MTNIKEPLDTIVLVKNSLLLVNRFVFFNDTL